MANLGLGYGGYSPQQQELFNPYSYGKNGIGPAKRRSGIGEFFLGKPEQFQRHPTQTPQGMEFLQYLLQNAQQGLQNPMAGFEPIAQDVTRQFNTETIPGLAERFTAMGGGQRSSAFQGALGNAGAGLASKLAALGSQYGLENRRALLQQGQLGLTPQFETTHRPETQGALGTLLQSLAPALQGAASEFGKGFGQWGASKAFGQGGNSGQGGGNEDLRSMLQDILSKLS